jgi:transposase-like protein
LLLHQEVGVESCGVQAAHEQLDSFNDFPARETLRTPETASKRGGRVGRAKLWSAEQRFEIVLQSLRGEEPNAEICRRYRISEPTLYKWRQLFFQGARIFLGDSGSSVKQLAEENQRLKEMVVDLSLAYRKLRVSRPRPAGAQQKVKKWPPSTE